MRYLSVLRERERDLSGSRHSRPVQPGVRERAPVSLYTPVIPSLVLSYNTLGAGRKRAEWSEKPGNLHPLLG